MPKFCNQCKSQPFWFRLVRVREYDGESWDWYVVPEDDGIPEEILLKILGSRKPILFAEGEEHSLDCILFSYLYPEFIVVPCGGCEHVIHNTRAFTKLNHLHHLECLGIVDYDHRTDQEVEYLQKRDIYVLEVSEVENLLLHDGVLQYVGRTLGFDDRVPKIIESAHQIIFDRLREGRNRVAASVARRVIESSFTSFDAKVKDGQQLEENWDGFVESIDVQGIYAAALEKIDGIIHNRDYESALKVYDNKGLVRQVSALFDMKPHGFVDWVKRFVSSERDEGLIAILQQYIPSIEVDHSLGEALAE